MITPSRATKPLLPPLPALPPDEALVSSLAHETRLSPTLVRSWLAGERRVSGAAREALLNALWAPLGGMR